MFQQNLHRRGFFLNYVKGKKGAQVSELFSLENSTEVACIV